jgi:hypothetical protein
MDRSQVHRPCRTSLAAACGCWVVLSAVGCSMSLPFARNNDLGPALPENAGVEEIVRRVNANIEHLQAWRSSDLRISGRSLPVHLTGHIAVEGPRNFRLTAGALGMTDEADFGSNSEWFWFWVRRGEPNYVFRARHDDMEHNDMLRQQIPFQPDWLIEALGVVPIDPKQVTRMEAGETHQTVNLISELLSPLRPAGPESDPRRPKARRGSGPLPVRRQSALDREGRSRQARARSRRHHAAPDLARMASGRPANQSRARADRDQSDLDLGPHLGSPQQGAAVRLVRHRGPHPPTASKWTARRPCPPRRRRSGQRPNRKRGGV